MVVSRRSVGNQLRTDVAVERLRYLNGSIEVSERDGKNKWECPAELTLNQNGDALAESLVFAHPQGGRVQVPASSGVVSKDSVTFSGQNPVSTGGSIEFTFHGKESGTSLTERRI